MTRSEKLIVASPWRPVRGHPGPPLSRLIVPVTPSIGLASRAPYTLALHDNVWLSARRVTEALVVEDFLLELLLQWPWP